MDLCAGGVGYYLFGYAFAYGDPQSCDSEGVCSSTGNPFIGSKMFALHSLSEDAYQTYFFQFVVSCQMYRTLEASWMCLCAQHLLIMIRPLTKADVSSFCLQFAVSTATICAGAVAERVKFVAYGL